MKNETYSIRKSARAADCFVVAACSLLVLVVALSTCRGLLVSPQPTPPGAFYHSGAGDLVFHRYVLAAWTETDEATEWHFKNLTPLQHVGTSFMAGILSCSILLLFFGVRQKD